MSEISIFDSEHLPPELLLDEDHPANDQYLEKQRNVERMMVAHQRTMKPRHVNIAKLVHSGMPAAQIAEKVGVTDQTVYKVKDRQDVKRLLSLMAYYKIGREGPSESQRMDLLWKIARRNAAEDEDNKVAISAVAEMNRMTMADYTRKQNTAPGQTTIIINQQLMPKGALDQ